jgi:tryptophan-rich sensory protein
MTNGPLTQLIGLAGWLLISFSAAAIGGVATSNAGDFYQQLDRPSWAPPESIFGPVWSALYFLMGISAWLVWRERGFSQARVALWLFVVQHVFNALWSWLFFAWQRGALSFAEIIVLWLLIFATLVMFWRVRPLAGMMLVPYLLWVTYAAALNYSLWQRNPEILG